MQVLQFVHGIVAPLADVPVAELALQIYLQAAYSASEVAHLEMIAYEFMEQACFLTCTWNCTHIVLECLGQACFLKCRHMHTQTQLCLPCPLQARIWVSFVASAVHHLRTLSTGPKSPCIQKHHRQNLQAHQSMFLTVSLGNSSV